MPANRVSVCWFSFHAGKTRRDGLELGLEHATTDRLTLSLSWTWSDFRFQEFFDTQQNVDVSGNRLPGIPQHQLFAELDWQAESGLFASVESFHCKQIDAVQLRLAVRQGLRETVHIQTQPPDPERGTGTKTP